MKGIRSLNDKEKSWDEKKEEQGLYSFMKWEMT